MWRLGVLLMLPLLFATGCVFQDASKDGQGKPKRVQREVDVEIDVTRQRCRKMQPCVDNPISQRYRNPDGSCVHCSFATVLAHQGQDEMADWWHEHYHGGEGSGGLRSKALKAGLRYSDTTSGSTTWIDWAMRTGRGAIVNDKPGHVRTLVGLDPAGTPNAQAYVLDNNGPPTRIITYGRDEWLRMWRRQGGWAATAVYNPNPPTTWN